MLKEQRICINCVTPLKKESKKLGSKSVWYVCPDCGLRERPSSREVSETIQQKMKRETTERDRKQSENY